MFFLVVLLERKASGLRRKSHVLQWRKKTQSRGMRWKMDGESARLTGPRNWRRKTSRKKRKTKIRRRCIGSRDGVLELWQRTRLWSSQAAIPRRFRGNVPRRAARTRELLRPRRLRHPPGRARRLESEVCTVRYSLLLWLFSKCTFKIDRSLRTSIRITRKNVGLKESFSLPSN